MKIVKQNLVLILTIPAIILIVGVVFFIQPKEQKNYVELQNDKQEYQTVVSSETQKTNLINEIFVEFTDELFYTGISSVDKNKDLSLGVIKAGVISHHDLASGLIADFFYQLSKQDIDRIIIVGPNHPDVGLAPAISTHTLWKTKIGETKQDDKLIDELNNKGLLQFDHEHIINEHAIGTLIPFIQYYLPEVKIVPIILTSKHDKEMSFRLAEILSEYVKEEGTVMIGSIDFSHYLNSKNAYENDVFTIKAIEKYDYNFFAEFDSDYIDSPPSIMTVLKTMEFIGSKSMYQLGHMNSAEILGEDIAETTSYFSLFWHF